MIKNPKENILVSFSGGETSAYMIYWLLKNKPNYNYKFIYANTGEENEETLLFAKQCEDYFSIKLVWVEYKELSFKIVNYKTAYRSHDKKETQNKWKNHPFRKYIEKFMIPNKQNMTCTRELKEYPITRYLSSIGWTKSKYTTAIGIRNDEIDRIGKHYYPLAMAGITKPMINNFWDKMPFRLELKGYQGNCKTCWKKSFRKLGTLYLENPNQFMFMRQMEKEYGNFIRETQKHRLKEPMNFFRGNKKVDDIREITEQENFKKASDDSIDKNYQISILDELNQSNGCIESCEVFS